MRLISLTILTFLGATLLFVSCQKWKDPKGYTDPRLTNPYCNDPNAVNYNYGFPGRPDDSVCYYPTDLFSGRLIFTDSILHSDNSFYLSKIDTLELYPISQTQLAILGLCSAGDSIHFTVDRTLRATVDTTEIFGSQFCRTVDTVSGYIYKDAIDSTLFHVNLTVNSDTGITYHTGSAIKG